jgi:hypothetical protein
MATPLRSSPLHVSLSVAAIATSSGSTSAGTTSRLSSKVASTPSSHASADPSAVSHCAPVGGGLIAQTAAKATTKRIGAGSMVFG